MHWWSVPGQHRHADGSASEESTAQLLVMSGWRRASSNGGIVDPDSSTYRFAAAASSTGTDRPLVSVIIVSSTVLSRG
jgi:hypothetical protein